MAESNPADLGELVARLQYRARACRASARSIRASSSQTQRAVEEEGAATDFEAAASALATLQAEHDALKAVKGVRLESKPIWDGGSHLYVYVEYVDGTEDMPIQSYTSGDTPIYHWAAVPYDVRSSSIVVEAVPKDVPQEALALKVVAAAVIKEEDK